MKQNRSLQALLTRLRTLWADEKKRTYLLLAAGLAGMLHQSAVAQQHMLAAGPHSMQRIRRTPPTVHAASMCCWATADWWSRCRPRRSWVLRWSAKEGTTPVCSWQVPNWYRL